ncbi:MAG: hypothetical protein EOO96_18725 [Pedobacter sp.]|nr:MAG: hypothetical protein EOO96_18725 [Pedobacter sp.]
MKTSNKILIAFAAALILIPVLGMVIVSATQYKKGTHTADRFQAPDENNNTFAGKSVGKTAVKISETFTQIEFEDAKGSSIELHLNKDENFGAKVPEDLKDQIVFKVTNGVLKVSFKDGFNAKEFRNRMIIFLYAPSFKSLKGNNLFNFNLIATTEDLSVDLKDCDYFSLYNSDVTSTTVVNGDTTANAVSNQTTIKNLTLKLNHSGFNLADLDMNSLNITTSDSSTVTINDPGLESPKSLTIGALNLKTVGSNNVKIGKVKVNEAKGDFSDGTILQIPADLLNKMFKK